MFELVFLMQFWIDFKSMDYKSVLTEETLHPFTHFKWSSLGGEWHAD